MPDERKLTMRTQISNCRIALRKPRRLRTLTTAAGLLTCAVLFVGQLSARAQQSINVPNGSVSALVTAIQTLNAGGGGTINLASGGTYSVTAPSDWWYGPNAFPAIASFVTINGNGATISVASGSPNFRFFFVSGGFSTLPAGSLVLNNLTLTGGLALGGSGGTGSGQFYSAGGGGGGAGMGGAIYNQGYLLLSNVNLTGNQAVGGAGGDVDPNCNWGGGGGGLGGNGGNCDGSLFASAGGGGMQSGGSTAGNGGNFLGSEGGNGPNGGTSSYGGAGGGSAGCWDEGDGFCLAAAGSGGGGYAPSQIGIVPQFVLDSSSQVFDGGAGGIGGGAGGYTNPDETSQNPVSWWSSGGAFGGGGEGSAYGAGGGGGVGGGGGSGSGSYGNEQGGAGGFGGGGGGGSIGTAGSVFGGGAGGAGSPAGGSGGNGLGGAVFNQLGQVYLYSVTFSGNKATGGTTPSDAPGNGIAGNGLGGAVANLDGELWMTDVTASGDSTRNGYGSAGQGSEVYVTSDPGGLTSATQTPTATLHLVGTSISSSAIALNQVSGTVTETTDVPVGQSTGTFTVTVPITQAGTIGPAPYVVTGGALSLDFNRVSGGTCAQGASLTVGQTCTVSYTFNPTAVGLREGAVSVIGSSLQLMGNVFVSGIGQGTQIAFDPGTQSTIAGDWEDGVGAAAIDGFGNIYVAEVYDGTIEVISKNNQYGGYYPPSVLISGVGIPTSVAVDGSGDIFYTDWLYSAVYELPFDGYSYQNTVSLGLDVGWSSPQSVAVDAQGNVFVTDLDQNGVFELPWTSTGFGPSVALPSYNFGYMANLAVDSADNVFVTDNGNSQVVEYPFTTSGYGTPVVIPVNTPSLWGIATDGVGNLYLSDSSTGTVMSMLAQPGWQFGPPTTVATGLNAPLGMALDPNGNIFVAPGGGTSLVKIDQFDPPTINFATATVVGSVDIADGPQTVSVRNVGNQPLTFSTPGAGANPSYPANFIANTADTNLCTSAGPVAVGAICDISVNFSPAASGGINASVVLTDNAPNPTNGVQSIPLSGTALGTQTISFNPATPVNFGVPPITLAATGGASGNPVTFTLVSGPATLSGTNNSVLTVTAVGTIVIAANQAGNASYLAAPQVTQSIVVQTPPLAALTSPSPGSTLAGPSLTFSWTAESGSNGYFLHLGTTGVGSTNLLNSAEYSSTTTSVAINNLPVNGGKIYVRLFTDYYGTHLYQDYVLTASAQAGLTLPGTSGTLAGPTVTFGWSAATGSVNGYFLHLGTTAAGSMNLLNSAEYPTSTTSVTVNNLPVNGETIYARLYTDYNGMHLYQDYTFTASAQPVLALSATSLSFGSVFIGSSSTSQTVTLTNTGFAALSISSIAVTGANASSFVFANSCGTSLAVGANCTIHGYFHPTAAGALTAAVTITDNASNSPQSIALRGTGFANVLSTSALSFGNVPFGQTPTLPVTITNSTSANLVVTAIGNSGANPSAFTTTNNCTGSPILPSGTCTIHVTFAAPTVGSYAAWLSVAISGYPAAQVSLSGTATGARVAFTPASQSTVGSGWGFPVCTAVDAQGNLYVADQRSTYVEEIPAGGGSPIELGTGLSNPNCVAVDGLGNVYISDLGNGRVVEVPVGGGTQIVLTTGLTHPEGIGVDGSGNVYVADTFASRVDEIPAGGGTPVALGSGWINPSGLAVDAAGDVFVSDGAANSVVELPAGGGSPITIIAAGILNDPSGLALDAVGNLYVSDTLHSRVIEVLASGGGQITVASAGLKYPYQASVDSAGNLYIPDGGVYSIFKVGTAHAPSLSFATTNAGSASSDSPQVVTAYNSGNASLAFTGLNVPANFSLVTGSGTPPNCSITSTVAAGASCELPIGFTPETSGILSGSVVLTDNSLSVSSATQSIAVSGTGVGGPLASFTATSLSFGSVNLGATSNSQTVTLTNTGTIPLPIASIAVTGTNASSFVFANSCGTSLAVGANCTIHGHFAPTAIGAQAAAITITDSAPGSPQTIALSGTGLKGPVTLSAYSIAFGSATTGTWSASQSVVLTNTGTAALTFTSIAVTGTNASQFAMANSCGATLAVGATCTIHGHFQPTIVGAITANVTITDSATTSPQTIALTGKGVAAATPVTLSPASLSFSSVTVGTISGSQTVTITNTGAATLTITSIAVTGTNASQFVFANSCGTTLAVGAACTVHGHFAPTATGAMTAAITITDSAAGSPQTIALSGTGD